MGKRTTARRLAMQALYQADVTGIAIDAALTNVAESELFIPETVEFATSLARSTWAEKEEIDQIISELAIDWSLDRLSKVDRSILRLSLYELRLKETPKSVVINEAVELAKRYSGIEGAKFINGILGSFARQLP